MLSLAPWLYRNVFAQTGGPICSMTCALTEVFGRPTYQANAYLSPDLVPEKTLNGMYGNCDGTGSNSSLQIARHMAISEALERWAYWTASRSAQAERFAFDIDNSTNGMAAFPGFYRGQARRLAYHEALERWALASWWVGELEGEVLPRADGDTAVFRIDHGQDGEVAVVFRCSPAGHYSYGYAAGSNLATTVQRATIEMARNDFVLSYAKLRGADQRKLTAYERRCLYFASEEGHREFLKHTKTRVRTRARWQVVFDGEVTGPWSRFATVWRVLASLPWRARGGPDDLFGW